MVTPQQIPLIIEQLELSKYYPKKLTREKALAVSDIRITTNDLKEAGKIPWFILQNLLMCNYEGRCFEVSQDNSSLPKMGDSFSFFTSHSNTASKTGDTEQISPSDALIALFWCCDDFLRQILVEKMSMCQLAVPLILPLKDVNSHGSEMNWAMSKLRLEDVDSHGSEMLIWAMSTLRKQWKTSLGSCEHSMTMYPLPIISVIRLGRPLISKSKIINYVISDLRHNVFFHSECDGGTLERKISDGLLEIAWYLPTGKPKDISTEGLTFLNLRGNASHLKTETEFLSEISLVTIAFASSMKPKEEDVTLLETLYEQNGHLILVTDGQPSKEFTCSLDLLSRKCDKKENKHFGCIDSSNKNESQTSKEIRRLLIDICKNGSRIVPDKSIEMCTDIAKRLCFNFDESSGDCVEAKESADMMFSDLKKHDKGKRLPLQEIAIRLGEKEKEMYQLKHKGNQQVEKYVESVQSDIKSLRMTQKEKCDEDQGILALFERSFTYPILKRRYFHSFVKIMGDKQSIEALQPIRKEYTDKWKKLCEDLQEKRITEKQTTLIKKELDCLEEKLSDLSLSLEHFNREVAQMYEMKSFLKLLDDSTLQFPVVAAKLLLNGYPLELMDGDASLVPLIWIEAVLATLKDEIGNNSMFVLSVLGVQNSGKSTMLNTMFGLQFAVSAGRCTKGVFAQLLPVDGTLQESTGCDYIMVIDTEGLRAPELASIAHSNRDNELATLVIGLGDATIINIMGENTSEIQDILQIVVHAFMKMKCVNIKPSCIFVHQNVTDVTAADVNTTQKRKIKEILDEITKCAANEENCSERFKTFSDVIQFKEHKHVMYISNLWEGDPPMASPNPGYSEGILQVKRQIIQFMQQSQGRSFKDFQCRLSDLWKAILCENFVFSFKNTIEIQAFNALESEYLTNSRKLRRNAMEYMNILQVQCKKLTAKDIVDVGKKILEDQISNVCDDVQTLRKNMNEYFDRETMACQWKSRTFSKIDELSKDIMKEINDEFVSLKNKIIGRNTIDSSMKKYEKDILEKAKDLADMFRDKKLSDSDLKKKFDDKWKNWIDDIPLCVNLDIDIQSSLERVIIESSCSRYQEQIYRMFHSECSSPRSQTWVTEDDLNSGCWTEEHATIISNHAVSKSTCIDKTKLFTETVRSNVLQKISNYRHEGKNYSDQFGNHIVDFITGQLSEQKMDNKAIFTDLGLVRVAVRIVWSVMSELNNLKDKYKEENDLRCYMESQKDRLWQMFRDECTTVEISVKTASMVCRELENAIKISLPNLCKNGVIDHLRTSNTQAFANKMSLHAQMLIDLAEKHNFKPYQNYLQNPHECMRTYIGQCIHNVCLSEMTKGKPAILKEIYCKTLDNIFLKADKAINGTCKYLQDKCKISSFWSKLMEHIGNDLDVKNELGFFNEDCNFDVEESKNMLLTELRQSKKKLIKEYNGEKVLDGILKGCQKFFEKDLLGCPELCPFCKAPCELQGGYDDHRTEYHRPQGVSGYYLEDTKKLVTSVCTSSVRTQDTFRNKDTNYRLHLFKDFQSVNKFYKAWKIQPTDIESQLYWKWFMAKYNKQLADYYNVKKADIPNGWKKISWESAKEDMIKTYNL
ncbi:interferon-induced very large GTPase 1-like [Anneissia japonica]|uniref:interferon-induced very large GTPase 1-like n=1 Tax=Anneissia japonica TaxID=1529436 RepID=UPI001425A428|nr:interferon-induced very large GTPase 1-like [Anneissia japonica]